MSGSILTQSAKRCSNKSEIKISMVSLTSFRISQKISKNINLLNFKKQNLSLSINLVKRGGAPSTMLSSTRPRKSL
jgi:hypothetical protein